MNLIPLSFAVLLIIAVGILFRKNRKIHIPVMLLAFVCDMSLVLYIEFSRKAVEQVISGLPSALLAFHVATSLIVVLLYLALIISGVQIVKGKTNRLLWHRQLATAFLIGRMINFVTSLYIN
ncbi:MAG: hypothetical protein K2X01_04795 [Cyanobacteria bacterium]|nr:hypothetical protein [Cyanobacteriota bacterium]